MKEVTESQLHPCSNPRTRNQGTSHDGTQVQGLAWRFLPGDSHCSQQHRLKRSCAGHPPIEPAPRCCTPAQGTKKLIQKQGTAPTPMTLLLKPPRSGCVTGGITFPQGQFIQILQGSLSGVQNGPALAGLGAPVQQGRGQGQQRAVTALGCAQHEGPRSRRADTGGAAAPGQASGASQSARHRGAPPHPAQPART